MLSPSSRSWKHDVSTLFVSWKGRNADLTLGSLIKQNYPHAVKLQDIVGVQPKERLTKAENLEDKSVQTKDVYTRFLYLCQLRLPPRASRGARQRSRQPSCHQESCGMRDWATLVICV